MTDEISFDFVVLEWYWSRVYPLYRGDESVSWWQLVGRSLLPDALHPRTGLTVRNSPRRGAMCDRPQTPAKREEGDYHW